MKTKPIFLSLVILLSLISVSGYAAGERSLWKKAERHIASSDFDEALNTYLQLYDKDNENSKYAFKIGYCYLHSEALNDIDLAKEWLSKASENISTGYKDNFGEDQAPAETEYYLGIAYRLTGNYEKAMDHLKTYKAFDERNNEALTEELIDREISSCEYSISNPPEKFEVKKYSFDISIPEGQLLRCPVISGNDSVFVYTMGTSNVFPSDINTDRDQYHIPMDDIYYSTWEDGRWSDPENITEDLKTGRYIMPVSLSFDGTRLLLVHDDSDDGNIYAAEFENGKWNAAKKLNNNINSGKWESHAVMNKAEDKMYFTSERPGGLGGLDLYISETDEEGKWSEPENLGGNINTALHEETPFLLERENQLYFASESHGNMGGFDMFVSVYDSLNNQWNEPINLGYPYNTVGNDLAYIVSFQGKFIYCPQNSNKRREGISGSDCFSLRMPYEKDFVRLEGQIYIPELDNTIPADLQIAVISDETGDTVNILHPRENGRFTEDQIPVGKVTLVAMSSENIKNQVVNVSVPIGYEKEDYPLDIYLSASEMALALRKEEEAGKDQFYVAQPVYFDYNSTNIDYQHKENLTELAGVLRENTDVKLSIQGHTDHKGSESFNYRLGLERANAVKEVLKNEGVDSEQLQTESFGEKHPVAKQLEDDNARQYNRRVEFLPLGAGNTIQMADIDVPEQYRIEKDKSGKEGVLSIKQVLFDFDSYELTAEHRANLSQLARYLTNHPEISIQINGHCDHYGTDSYNMWLGKKRAESISSYLVEKGVNKERISLKSYGDTQPIARQLDTNRARQYNRRAEIELMNTTEKNNIEILPFVVPAELRVE
ncbi:MAG: OmpA family protein [Bacteroidota bacterium]